ncbi:MAG: sigma-54 dependent transcriptional regulator [Myxococcota bacterium]|jgi:two-component system response regulator HydG|nr:sigma-54 dependent transcriptional regulator [Myxococcota bacterium]
MATILIIEDNETLREGIKQVVKRMNHRPITAANGRIGLELFASEEPDLILTDLKMDEIDGMEVLRSVQAADPEMLVMIVTAFGSIERAVEAMKEGAFDFIPKPFPPDLLRTKINKALEVREQRQRSERLSQENDMLRAEAAASYSDSRIIGESEAMERIFKLVGKVARTDSTVHIFGESGTGKELVARSIHDNSPRKDGPFIKVNCSALAETLLESELFGHEKGSFTGAHKRKLGRFELADGGTLFLDEIGDISQPTQLKLLRILQERQLERVGGEETITVDVRVVTATNKDLKREVEEGRFREDLFYRLHIIPVELPPLRDRKSDIPLIVEHFVDKLAKRTRSDVNGVAADAMAALRAYNWPGNVRELENVIEHAMVFAEGSLIRLGDLPPVVSGVQPGDALQLPDGDRSLPEILEELERQLILRAFKKAEGVKTETARLLGIKPSALYYKLDKYEIDESVLG